MVWTQRLEEDDIELDELKETIASMETEGTLQQVSFELISDEPINVHTSGKNSTQPTGSESKSSSKKPDTPQSTQSSPSNGETESTTEAVRTPSETTKYTTEPSSSAGQKAKSANESTSSTVAVSGSVPDDVEEIAAESASVPISVRKWPRMDQELSLDYDLPLAAAAYPTATENFTGDDPEDVEHDTPYYARVNGRKDYGVFVTLNGSGLSPNGQYHEVTGLIHRSNILGRGPFNYAQGDEVAVELESHSDEGLSFRELPILSTDDAKQARHTEVLRLNRLDLSIGEEIRFGKWPEERERTGTVTGINWGDENPPCPPTVEVEVELRGNSGVRTYELRPSEVVAQITKTTASESQSDTNVRAMQTTPSQGEQLQASDISNQSDDDLPTELSLPETSEPETGQEEPPEQTGEPTTGGASDDAEEDTSDDDAEEDTPDDDIVCPCGRDDFDSKRQLWGHQSSCDVYRQQKAENETQEEDAQDSDSDGGSTESESGQGRVVKPVALDISNEYAKLAAAMWLIGEDDLRVRDLVSRLQGTEWEMSKTSTYTHLSTLRDKDAATRQKDGVYRYSLTERGEAGAKKMLEGVDDERLPDLE